MLLGAVLFPQALVSGGPWALAWPLAGATGFPLLLSCDWGWGGGETKGRPGRDRGAVGPGL